MEILGLSGYARSGKDAAAEALSSLGFRRISFADKLREFVYAINPMVEYETEYGHIRTTQIQDVINEFGWNGYKETQWADSIRKQMQVIGTECCRNILGENIWVNATLDNLPDGKYVITDVRFPNEADEIRARGGSIIRIVRDGVGPVNDHFSERALDSYRFDSLVHNQGTLQEFQETMLEIVRERWY